MGYTDLSKVKQDLGISDTTKDVVLSTAINSASTFIDSYLGYSLAYSSYDEFYDIRDVPYNKTIYLRHRPIGTITFVKYNTVLLNPSTDYFIYNNYIKLINLTNYSDNIKLQQSQIYEISYTAGYQSIPSDVEYACRRLVVEMFNKKSTGNIVSESVGAWNRTYARKGVGQGLDSEVEMILTTYQMMTI